MTHIAAIQMVSGLEVPENLAEARRLIEQAAAAGAKGVVLPENFSLMASNESAKKQAAERLGEGRVQTFMQKCAKTHRIWLVGGTITIQEGKSLYSACLVYNDQGERVGVYHKIHLFDVKLPDTEESHQESSVLTPGNKVVVIDSPFGRMGLAICYDIRFPELFRQMLTQGVEIIVLPAAFTATTGHAHWDVLVRARAIENQCYFVASAQGGLHANQRETFGHSMIVDPWGVVLDSMATGSGFVMAECPLARMQHIRGSFPAIEHRRLHELQGH